MTVIRLKYEEKVYWKIASCPTMPLANVALFKRVHIAAFLFCIAAFLFCIAAFLFCIVAFLFCIAAFLSCID